MDILVSHGQFRSGQAGQGWALLRGFIPDAKDKVSFRTLNF